MTADVTTDAGYFAMVPEWLLDADVSGNAVKLYAVLRRYADKASHLAHPSRKTLATRMRLSRPASVDPIIKELVDAGAVETFERWSADGDRDSNGYRVITAKPNGVVRSTAPRVVGETAQGVVPKTEQELEPVKPESGEPEKGSARKRATRIPEPFMVTAAMRQWAAERAPHVNVNLATEKFVNYWRAKSSNATKLDWPATWRNWILADAERTPSGPARGGQAKDAGVMDVMQRGRELQAQLDAKRAGRLAVEA